MARTAASRAASLVAPEGVIAERFEVDGEAFVAFRWDLTPSLPELTPAEDDVFKLLVRGASNRAIAAARKASVRTVANQVANVLRKLKVESRYELMARYAGTARNE